MGRVSHRERHGAALALLLFLLAPYGAGASPNTAWTISYSASFAGQGYGLIGGTYYDDGGYGISHNACQYISICVEATLPGNIGVTGQMTATIETGASGPYLSITTANTATSILGTATSSSTYTVPSTTYIPGVGAVALGFSDNGNPQSGAVFGGADMNAASTFTPLPHSSGSVSFTGGAASLQQFVGSTLPNNGYPIPYSMVSGVLTGGSESYSIGIGPPPTVQQLAALSLDAYASTPSGAAGYNVIQTRAGDFGFRATAYSNSDGTQIVVAPRGTSSADDRAAAYTRMADASFLGTTANAALSGEAVQLAGFLQDVAQANPGAQITLAGYSLGGGIAQIVGPYAGIQTVTFNSPGSGNFLGQFSSLGYLHSLNMQTPSTGIWDYRQIGDMVSLFGAQVGQSITVQNPNIPQGESGNLLEADLYGNFAGNYSYHALQGPFIQTLDTQPQTPGVLGDKEQLGNPDGFVAQTVHFAALQNGLETFLVPGITRDALQGFDPGPGMFYAFGVRPGSPCIGSVQLPIGGNIASWELLAYNGSNPTYMTSTTGLFDLGAGACRIAFDPLDATGQLTSVTDPFILGLTFVADGDVSAVLATDASLPDLNPPGIPVPEPSGLAVLIVPAAFLALRRQVRAGRRSLSVKPIPAGHG